MHMCVCRGGERGGGVRANEEGGRISAYLQKSQKSYMKKSRTQIRSHELMWIVVSRGRYETIKT